MERTKSQLASLPHLLQPLDIGQDLDIQILSFIVDPRQSIVMALDLGSGNERNQNKPRSALLSLSLNETTPPTRRVVSVCFVSKEKDKLNSPSSHRQSLQPPRHIQRFLQIIIQLVLQLIIRRSPFELVL